MREKARDISVRTCGETEKKDDAEGRESRLEKQGKIAREL